jgi:hypothetical protein
LQRSIKVRILTASEAYLACARINVRVFSQASATFLLLTSLVYSQVAAEHPQDAAASSTAAALPQLVDITESTRIKFNHLSSPEQKYIVESMSGGVALIDYDRDVLPDIYFTNAQSVAMVVAGQKSRSTLYPNNHDGTFTDVTDKAGVGYPCWAQGVAVGDYNNDGWPDLLVTCFGGIVLYRNNGDGTFTDATNFPERSANSLRSRQSGPRG